MKALESATGCLQITRQHKILKFSAFGVLLYNMGTPRVLWRAVRRNPRHGASKAESRTVWSLVSVQWYSSCMTMVTNTLGAEILTHHLKPCSFGDVPGPLWALRGSARFCVYPSRLPFSGFFPSSCSVSGPYATSPRCRAALKK